MRSVQPYQVGWPSLGKIRKLEPQRNRSMGAERIKSDTYEDYLALEAASSIKHEYHNGLIVAMAGGTPEHGLIMMNAGAELRNALRDNNAPCRVFSSDVRIRCEAHNRSYYPDVSVVCGEMERSESDPQALVNPVIIVEVLSDSTADLDRGEKFFYYRQIPSFQEYILISQHQIQVDHRFRLDGTSWDLATYWNPDDQLPLRSLPVTLRIGDLYRQVPGLG